MRIATAQPTPELPRAQRGGDSHQGMVGASGQRFTFFMRDGSLHEIEAVDAEAALEKLGDKLDKPKWLYRYWLLEAIEACLAPDPNYIEP